MKTIEIKVSDFNLKDTFECGQVFRYRRLADNKYISFSRDKKAILEQNDEMLTIESDDPEYFVYYLDLNRDYKKIKEELLPLPFMKESIAICPGIHLLNQDFHETLISFIISANNQIPRIRAIIEKICEKFGTNMGDYYAFPTLEQLYNAGDGFNDTGAGYRAKYLSKSSEVLLNYSLPKDINDKNACSYTGFLRKNLNDNFLGVGPKVADCILLFALKCTNVFPVDTWVLKIYKDIFAGKSENKKAIAKELTDIYKDLSGYAQQYLFYAKRLQSGIEINK